MTIAILGTLIGVSVPAVSMARQRTNRALCQSNLREVGMLFQMYLDLPKHGNRFPNAARFPWNDFKNRPGVHVYLDRDARKVATKSKDAAGKETTKELVYSNIQSIFHCPTDEEYFPIAGLSYEYNDNRPPISPQLAGKTWNEVITHRGDKLATRSIRILFDFDASAHGNPDAGFNRNFLYLDWHVDAGVDPNGNDTPSPSSSTSDSSTAPSDGSSSPDSNVSPPPPVPSSN
ncbi:MAG: hypothetical protein JNM18_27210 [Planctomycetaceae bacterium]|nr:hypothetical protein [Planctomycetaceae bacterium]